MKLWECTYEVASMDMWGVRVNICDGEEEHMDGWEETYDGVRIETQNKSWWLWTHEEWCSKDNGQMKVGKIKLMSNGSVLPGRLDVA
jgi:hypothetical protein